MTTEKPIKLPEVITEHNIGRAIGIAERHITTTRLVEELKSAEEDHEWYPTTEEIIMALCRSIGTKDREGRGGNHGSFLDIGAGNGKVLKAVKQRCGFTELFAIEKSSILCRQLPEDVLIVGTAFEEQSLLSKPVDVMFCNPPYSKYEAWSEKIIREANCKTVYLVIPERWQSSDPIQDALRYREVTAHKVGAYSFENSEDRKARAHVHLLKIELRHEQGEDDAFERWFKEQFADLISKAADPKPKCKCGREFDEENKHGRYYCPECHDFTDGKNKCGERSFNSLVVGPNYPEALVQLYNAEMENIQRNYHLVGQLDPEVMRELEVTPLKIMECLKARMKGLKNDYWQELFNHLDTITNRLTSKSRRSLLETLHKHVFPWTSRCPTFSKW